MSFAKVPYKEYESYDDFVVEFLLTAMEEGLAAIVIHYEDCAGLVQSLQAHTINGSSLRLDKESYDYFDEDIETAKNNGNLMLVTVFADNASVLTEPVLYTSGDSYAECPYFVEKDAETFLEVPVKGKVIPFMIV